MTALSKRSLCSHQDVDAIDPSDHDNGKYDHRRHDQHDQDVLVHLFEVKQDVVELFVDAFELVRLVGVVGRFEFVLLIFVHIVTQCKFCFAAYKHVPGTVIITCRTDAVKWRERASRFSWRR